MGKAELKEQYETYRPYEATLGGNDSLYYVNQYAKQIPLKMKDGQV